MFSTTTKKVSNYVFKPILLSIVHHRGTSQADLMCKSVDWFLYNRETLQGKGLIIASIIYTDLQLVHVHFKPGSREFGFEAFCIWFIFDRVWNLIAKMGSTENKSVCTVFRAYGFRKA